MSHASLVAASTTTASRSSDRKSKARDSSIGYKNLPLSLKTATASSTSDDAEAAEKRRKAAAAAARKRRQKIYSSRRRSKASRFVPRSRASASKGPSSSGVCCAISKTPEHSKPGSEESGFAEDRSTEWSSVVVGDFAPSSITTPIKKLASTIEGMAEVAQRWHNEEIVAIPTECTYEACISLRTNQNSSANSCSAQTKASPQDWAYRIQRARQVAMSLVGQSTESTFSSSTFAPYCWVPRSADCSFLKDCFPVRSYGMRDTNGRVHVAHRFNETHEVVQRIARHLWPGPVTFRVSVPVSEGEKEKPAIYSSQQRSFWSNLTSCTDANNLNGAFSGSPPCPHLTLRCPRHPLAIKVAQEHLAGLKGDLTGSNGEGCSSESADVFSVLVGFPIVKEKEHSPVKPKGYCRSSQDVQNKYTTSAGCSNYSQVNQTVSAVLDGENHSELFAVPTCEFGEPWHSEVWIHGPSRTITLMDHRRDESNTAPHSTIDIESLGGQNPSTIFGGTALSGTRIKSALRQRISRRPPLSKEKEQIIQAILCRWTVVEGKASDHGCQSIRS
ncbi:hypothetical protein ACA910_008516 [Epithemia clementina (nom. ined.)]